MSNRHLNRTVNELFRQVFRFARSLTRGTVLWVMRSLMLLTRHRAAQGFILPTVAMVSLVVIVLTGAMIYRSYDRSRNATNVRVDQAVLNAGAPAIDRARAKLAAMFEDQSLPRRGTPSDQLMQDVLAKATYTFDDEIRLKMVADFTNGMGTTNTGNNTFGENARPFVLQAGQRVPNNNYTIANDESTINAWKFPVDTDSNGKFDSYTLYAVNFRLPARNNAGEFLRPRSPLDARTPPMEAPSAAGRCAVASGAAAVTGADWYSTNNRKSKAFFIYSATVPIAAGDPILTNAALNPTANPRYEIQKQQSGFSAMEVQQDFAKISLNNNAIIFEDDLALSSGPPLRISGRLFTNSNLFMRGAGGNLDLYQVSSPASCFYQEENSKIVAGGNVKKGAPGNDNADGTFGGQDPGVHLYRVPADPPVAADVTTNVSFTDNDRSAAGNASDMSFNSLAYNQRIALMLEAALDPTIHNPNNDPDAVTAAIATRLNADSSLDPATVRSSEFEIYLRNRTRRVPNVEANYTANALARPAALGGGTYTKANVLQGASATNLGPQNQLRPPTEWMFPLNYLTNNPTGFTGVTLRTAAPAATDPATLRAAPKDKEQRVGDRVLVGNNMPALWYQCNDNTLTCNDGQFVGNTVDQPVFRNATTRETWSNNTQPRTRTTRVEKLDELDTISRNGLWETEASLAPDNVTDASENRGGVRIITGAGIYERRNSFLPPPPDLANVGRPSIPDDLLTNIAAGATGGDGNPFPYTINESEFPVVWPDTMPMSPGAKVYNNTTYPATEVDLTAGIIPLKNLRALTTTLTAAQLSTPASLGASSPLGLITGTAAPGIAATNTVDRFTPKYAKGDLRMRSMVVYHYQQDPANPSAYGTTTQAALQDAYQVPIACVSSYYDPSNPETARNMVLPNGTRLPDVSGGLDTTGNRTSPTGVLPATTIGDGIVDESLHGRALNDATLGGFDQNANAGKSNNSVVYNINPATDWTAARYAATFPTPAADMPTAAGNNGLFGNATQGRRNEQSDTLPGKLYYQANLVYPNGRFVNEPLRSALYSLGTNTNRELTLLEQSAIDSALCSLRILGDASVTTAEPTPSASPILPHGAIKEVTMLDQRQPKAMDGRFLKVASASATASTGTGTAATYTITYTIPASFRINWNGLASSTLDDATPADTKLSEIFDDNNNVRRVTEDVVTIQGFESVNPKLNADRGVVVDVDDANNRIVVLVKGTNTAIADTPAPKDSAGVTATLNAELDMPLEDRQPSEVRITQLDLNLLRTTELPASADPNAPREFMIPNTGIIYVSRDDSLRDLSDISSDNVNTRRILSSTDFRLDPTRKMGGVMLINGNRVDRVNQQRDVEKGLIVATNLSGYIRGDTREVGGTAIGDFNVHANPNSRVAQEEFTAALAADWSNFYTRSVAQINNNFACRTGGLNANCVTGDSWRPSVLLADSFSPLSRLHRVGYRSDGDFDLNNSQDTWISRAKRLKNGFFTNNFATSGLSGSGRGSTDPYNAALINANPFNGNRYTGNNNDIVDSTYFNNYVSPIQRRSQNAGNEGYPEYVMEICRKLPVSACLPQDWVIGYDANGDGDLADPIAALGNISEREVRSYQLGQLLTATTGLGGAGRSDANSDNILQSAEAIWKTNYTTSGNNVTVLNRLGAGTTALPAVEFGDRLFPRRMAFARYPDRTLVFAPISNGGNATPKPLGVGCPLNVTTANSIIRGGLGCIYPNTATRTAGTHYGEYATNALWFRNTNNITGLPDTLGDVIYQGDRPLYIMGTQQGGHVTQLPPTPEIPGVRSLNLPSGDDRASNYSLCTEANNKGSSKKVVLTDAVNQPELGRCSSQTGNPMTAIQNFRTDVLALNPDSGAADSIVRAVRTGTVGAFPATVGTTTTFTNPATREVASLPNVNVIEIGGDFSTGVACTNIVLDSGNDPDAIFIMRYGGSSILKLGGGTSDCGIQMSLTNVNPNNVFWVLNGNIQFLTVNSALDKLHRIYGTFVADANAGPKWQTVEFIGARFLGANGVPSGPTNITPETSITAVSSDAQPSLVPVLQYTALRDDPNSNIQPSSKNWSGNNNNDGDTRWRQIAPNGGDAYNVILAVGNNPGRVAPRVEGDGGIGNFPRFLENWNGQPLRINGGLFQIKRSIFATASDRTLLNEGNFTNPSNWTTFGYFQAYKTSNSGTANQWGINATYQPPNRLFGFDPAILSQLPDLFTEQFAVPAPTRNEFFQQLNRTDPWVQALLCATQPGTNTTTPLSVVGSSADPLVETNAARRQGFAYRTGVPTTETGDIPYQYPAVPLNNPIRPSASALCPAAANFAQYPSTCLSTGTTTCN